MSLEDKDPFMPQAWPWATRRAPSPAFDCRRLGLADAAIAAPAPNVPSPSGDRVGTQGSIRGRAHARAPTLAEAWPPRPAPAHGRARGGGGGSRRAPRTPAPGAGTLVRPPPTEQFGGRVTHAAGGLGRSPVLSWGPLPRGASQPRGGSVLSGPD